MAAKSGDFNRAVVSFVDVAGAPKTVTVTVDNPRVTDAGLRYRTARLECGTMTAKGARAIGREFLEQRK